MFFTSLKSFCADFKFLLAQSIQFCQRRIWFMSSSCSNFKILVPRKVEEGFTEESFNALKCNSLEYKQKAKHLYCSMIFDEMHIKRQIEWDGKKCHGFSSIGRDCTSSDPVLKAATQVLVILVVALDSSWKVPIGFFFHKGLNGKDKAKLVLEALKKLFEIGKFFYKFYV